MDSKMKCRYCGASVNLTDKVCQSCGKPNPLGMKYEQDSREYEKQVENVSKEIGKDRQYLVKMFVRGVWIIILIIVLIVSFVCMVKNENGNKSQIKAAKEYGVISETLDNYWDDEDYYSFYNYARSKNIAGRSTGAFVFYQPQLEAAQMYIFINNYLSQYLAADNVYDKNAAISNMSGLLAEFYDYTNLHYLYGQYVGSDESDKRIEGIHNHMGALLKTYFYISDDEAESIKNMSSNEIEILLEESVERHNVEVNPDGR